jgi:hypothetical protein
MVKNELNEDSNSVFDIIDPIKMKTDKKTVQMAHILYCGGPIADLKMCPRKTSEGLIYKFVK